jgi:hypothetical protein
MCRPTKPLPPMTKYTSFAGELIVGVGAIVAEGRRRRGVHGPCWRRARLVDGPTEKSRHAPLDLPRALTTASSKALILLESLDPQASAFLAFHMLLNHDGWFFAAAILLLAFA